MAVGASLFVLSVIASLFVLSVLCTALVYFTVPTTSYGVGPLVFPIVLGLFLMGLSLVLLGASLYNLRRDGERHPAAGKNAGRLETKSARTEFSLQMRVPLAVCVAIAVYGYFMQKIEAVVATFSRWLCFLSF